MFQSAEVFGCQIGRTGACVVEVMNVECDELIAEVFKHFFFHDKNIENRYYLIDTKLQRTSLPFYL